MFPGGKLEKPIVSFPLKADESGVYAAVSEDVVLDGDVRMHIAG